MNEQQWFETRDLEIIHETERAYKVLNTETGEELWLPKSQVKYDDIDGSFLIPEWLAIEKELI